MLRFAPELQSSQGHSPRARSHAACFARPIPQLSHQGSNRSPSTSSLAASWTPPSPTQPAGQVAAAPLGTLLHSCSPCPRGSPGALGRREVSRGVGRGLGAQPGFLNSLYSPACGSGLTSQNCQITHFLLLFCPPSLPSSSLPRLDQALGAL